MNSQPHCPLLSMRTLAVAHLDVVHVQCSMKQTGVCPRLGSLVPARKMKACLENRNAKRKTDVYPCLANRVVAKRTIVLRLSVPSRHSPSCLTQPSGTLATNDRNHRFGGIGGVKIVKLSRYWNAVQGSVEEKWYFRVYKTLFRIGIPSTSSRVE